MPSKSRPDLIRLLSQRAIPSGTVDALPDYFVEGARAYLGRSLALQEANLPLDIEAQIEPIQGGSGSAASKKAVQKRVGKYGPGKVTKEGAASIRKNTGGTVKGKRTRVK